MVGKNYAQGTFLALLWWGLILAALYAAARFAPEPWNMRSFIFVMAAVWPLLSGLWVGWRDGRAGGSGFAAALRGVAIPLLLLAVLWWWLFPQLWRAAFYGKFALYVLVTALLSGGFSAGLAKARQALYPPRPEDKDEEDDEDD